MNVGQAKEQIGGAVRAYLSTDARGRYRIPQRMQRPIIVFGPPGVGKTAIAAQVADEAGINFVSYSITHHTRQSALGLPYISTETFDGREYRVSDYTMSEIIAAVHRACAASGVAQGILFLDEVNCVSETLAPAMLQFLQFKTFGMHRLPEGWIIVCAGNPPEYNRAAREFDSALLDRIKRIDVEPDVGIWQDYAISHGVHPAVTTFLQAKPASFYLVRTDVTGPKLVTARGWEDLARMLQTYEQENIRVDADLVRQYLQDDQVAQEFFAYYELFSKYQDDYKIAEILNGAAGEELVARAAQAHFDEHVALVGLLLDAVLERIHETAVRTEALELARADLTALKDLPAGKLAAALVERADLLRASTGLEARRKGSLADRDAVKAERLLMLEALGESAAQRAAEGAGAFEEAKKRFNAFVDEHAAQASSAMASIDHAFAFLDAAFGDDSQEALIMVTKLSCDPVLVSAVATYGSSSYLKHNKSLLLDERNVELLRQIEALDEAAGGTAEGHRS